MTIQTLLNKWPESKVTVTGSCTGKADDATVKAIRAFQRLYSKNPDGRVDPGGNTLKKLNSEPFILLPQVSGFGYYSYGSGNWYERQWGTPATVAAIQDVAKQFRWNYPIMDIAVGDVSFRFGGNMPPHGTHREGKHVDLRPCRNDGKIGALLYTDTVYDQVATKLLIETFLSHKNVKNVLFNDPEIYKLPYVDKWVGHDNHFHVTMQA